MSNGNKSDIDALRDNIEHTRQRISGEIEAIGERLTPGHAREVARNKMVEAKDRAVGNVRGKMVGAKNRAIENARYAARRASDAGSNLPRVVKENPIPTAMVIVGSGWLVWNAVRRSREPAIAVEVEREPLLETEAMGVGYREHTFEPAVSGAGRSITGNAREKMGSVAQAAKSRLSGTAGAVKQRAGVAKERASHLAHRGREGASHAYGRSQDFYQDNPIALGAVCLFTGIGLGMLLPHTTREDRMLGERRQKVVDRAKHMASDAKEVAVHSAKEGMRAARETAKEEAGERDLISR